MYFTIKKEDKPNDQFDKVIIILNDRKYFKDLFLRSIPQISIRMPRNLSIGSTITIIDYILDTWYGAVVRRKGKVIVYRAKQ